MMENEMIDVLLRGCVSLNEWRILSLVNRLTVGFKQYRAVNLSFSDISEATGIDSSRIKKAVDGLLKKRLLIRTKKGTSRSSKGRYRMNYDSADWKLEGLKPLKIRTENYEGCELPTQGQTVNRCDTSVGGDANTTIGQTANTSMGQSANSFQAQTPAESRVEPGERKKKEKRKKRHTTCVLEGREHEYRFLNCREEIESKNDIGWDEAIWQAAMYVKKRWRESVTQDHLAQIETSFPDKEEPADNLRFALTSVHESVDEVMRMNREMKAKGGSYVKDPIGRSLQEAASRLAMAYDRLRPDVAEGYPI